MSQPLLSFVFFGRNDNYTPDFLYRLSTTINFIADAAKIAGRIKQVEIIVVDWASESKLKDYVQLSRDGIDITNFIYVPQSFSDSYCKGTFPGNICANIGLRRASGKLVGVCGAEVLLTESSIQQLCQLVEGSLSINDEMDKLYVCGRYRLPAQWVLSQPSIKGWKTYLQNNSWRIAQEPGRGSFLTGNAGLFLIPQKMLKLSHGLLEALDPFWGWNDVEFTARMLSHYPCIDLNSSGVAVYDMEHFDFTGDRQHVVKKTAPRLLSQSFAANDENWGAGKTKLICEKATLQVISDFSQHVKGLLPVISDDRLDQFAIWMADNLAELPNHKEISLLVILFNHFKTQNILFVKEYGINQGHTFYLFAFMFKHSHLVGIDKWLSGGGEYGVDHIAYNLTTPVMEHIGHLRLINTNLIAKKAKSLSKIENQHSKGVVLYRANEEDELNTVLLTLKNDLKNHQVLIVGPYAEKCIEQTNDIKVFELIKGYAYSLEHEISLHIGGAESNAIEYLMNFGTNVSHLCLSSLINSIEIDSQVIFWGNNNLTRLLKRGLNVENANTVESKEELMALIKNNKKKVIRTF